MVMVKGCFVFPSVGIERLRDCVSNDQIQFTMSICASCHFDAGRSSTLFIERLYHKPKFENKKFQRLDSNKYAKPDVLGVTGFFFSKV